MADVNADNQLRKSALGSAQIAFFVISAAGPLVAMAGGVPLAMLFGNGAGLPAMFVTASCILLAFAAGYTAMAKEVQNAGAFYAFAARGLGGSAAGATGMIAILSYNAIQIGLYGMFGTAAKALIDPILGHGVYWWVYASFALIAVAALGYRQVDLSARILGLLVAAEYLVVVVLIVAIVLAGGHHGLSARSFSPDTVLQGSPPIGLMLCFSAFVGFEATTIYSEEARDPARTIPLATYLSVVLIGAFYTLASWAVVNGAGVAEISTLLRQSHPTDLLFSLASRYVGLGLSTTMHILFVTSTFASLLAFHNAIARYFYAMGRERLLAPPLGRSHPKHKSPHIASLAQSLLAIVCIAIFALSSADPILVVFTLPSAVATLGIIILMAITSAAALRYLGRSQRNAGVRILTALALISFVGVAGIATLHFDALAGGNLSTAIRFLPLTIPGAGGIGVALALRLRVSDPRAYARLGVAPRP